MEFAAPIWAPDGKSFAYREGDKLMLYDVAAKNSRELLAMGTLNNVDGEHLAARPHGKNRG